jgi:hypothetical protein
VEMMTIIRINSLYHTLFKSIKNGTNTSILVQCCSENAAKSAYNGIKYTIECFLKELEDMKLDEYIDADYYKFFQIKNAVCTTTIIIRNLTKENNILFLVNNNMILY